MSMDQQNVSDNQRLNITDEELLILWKTETNMKRRDQLIRLMKERNLFPKESNIDDLFGDFGMYPDVEDPNFVSRLLQKSEFADTYSHPQSADDNPCGMGPDFEITPVQRFVANFLHPRTPYMSALLYHGVGVGKTCAAIQTAEAYLDVYPRRKVMIVAPPTIQEGFRRTIFDIDRLQIGTGSVPNKISGCTGNTYLRLMNLTMERNKDIIQKDIKKAIQRRYEFYGYLQFRNHIRAVLSKVSTLGDEETVRLRQIEAIRREFKYRLLIVDEAHNLRDITTMNFKCDTIKKVDEEEVSLDDEEDRDTVGTPDEKEEEKAGKLLTPFLLQLICQNEGMKLLLMTATPMFNNVQEIVLLLNLLLMNDKKAPISQNQILDENGELVDGADEILKPIANAYVSFMRGENPNSFPLRLYPKQLVRMTADAYPTLAFSKEEKFVDDADKNTMEQLPIIVSECPEDSISQSVMSVLTVEGAKRGTGYEIRDRLLQAGNCVFPVDSENKEDYVGLEAFKKIFTKQKKQYLATDASWLQLEEFQYYSPKCATILRSLNNCDGVAFMYSRFVAIGALIMALALEANGYTLYGREPLLRNGVQGDEGRQCAKCSSRERGHQGDHSFVPAKYVILTGDKEISPHNKESIQIARSDENFDGGLVKVVLGSQIAGEGIDLRFIREVHILDAWFHLNKTEQIIGRGIRFCSHSKLDITKRNTTVFLHVLTVPGLDMETSDLYSYRSALHKAKLVGKVSRKLKQFAVDCNLRKEVTVLRNLGRRVQIDSQGAKRDREDDDPENETGGIRMDDMPYTALCDWMENCEYTCSPVVDVNLETSDDSTYTAFSARYRETKLQKIIQQLFAKQPIYSGKELEDILITSGAPITAIHMTIQGILNNRLFRVRSGAREGYIVYKNRYFIFQPDSYNDITIPIAIRIANYPIKRDEFTPQTMEMKQQEQTVTIKASSNESMLWTHLNSWVDKVVNETQKTIGIELERLFELYISEYKENKKIYQDKLLMILEFTKRIYKTNKTDDSKTRLKAIYKQYFWDEWMNNETQFKNADENPSIADENIVMRGENRAYRFINSETNELIYLCDDGNPCSFAMKNAFEQTKDDTMTRRAVKEQTGDYYGFIVPKQGKMIFKTNESHADDGKPATGQECAIISSKNYILKLIKIGDQLTKNHLPNLDFSEAQLKSPGEISNAQRGCTLVNLSLRYMDSNQIDGKRWFFRPLAAFYSGHRGKITKEARKIVEKEQLQEKQKEKKEKKEQRKAATIAKKVSMKEKKPASVAPAAKTTKRLTLKKPSVAAAVLPTIPEQPPVE